MNNLTSSLSDEEYVSFKDRESIQSIHDDDSHLLVYGSFDEEFNNESGDGLRTQSLFVMCALISLDDVEEYLKEGVYYNYPFADLGRPSLWGEAESDEVQFSLGQDREDNGIKAHYFIRSYFPNGSKEQRFPVAQSFIFYHELTEHIRKYKRLFVDDVEDVEVIIEEIHPSDRRSKRVKINRHYLREYLTARNMALALWTNVRRTSYIGREFNIPESMDEGPSHMDVNRADWDGDNQYFGEFVHKSIVMPYEDIKWSKQYWSMEDDQKQAATFVTGIDKKSGAKIESDAKTPFLKPVYFKKEALSKYIGDSRARVETASKSMGQIKFLDQWSITYGLNDINRIVLWLGDIHKLPYNEQIYWKHFNIPPEGGIGKDFFETQIEGKWSFSGSLEKQLLDLRASINEKFKAKHGGMLFSISEEDTAVIEQLHTAIGKDSKAIKPQIMAIVYLFIESIDKKLLIKILKQIDCTDELKELGSISLLQKYYEMLSGSQYDVTNTMQLAWKLRSNYVHRFKEASYVQEIETYDSRVDPLDPGKLYPHIMKQLIRQLTTLESCITLKS